MKSKVIYSLPEDLKEYSQILSIYMHRLYNRKYKVGMDRVLEEYDQWEQSGWWPVHSPC